ncbi:hypothetical protein BDN71DRAFT_1442271 [Pleurotus eryngii]|uniref:Uncharacterized protein n=1 Tax=Pleurotus eryngii TaxID=5323 RepID=A0A9P6DJE2_PLEER|nr:hypothetical protein BDN71DRAFT_1442271 [Pleurotus eryngii]
MEVGFFYAHSAIYQSADIWTLCRSACQLTSMNANAFLDAKNRLALVNGISFYLTLTPPNRPVPERGQIIQSTYEKTILVHLPSHGRHSFAHSAYSTF